MKLIAVNLNINTNTDRYRSLLFLLPLDVDILNSIGLYSGREAYECIFGSFICYMKYNMYKINIINII